MAKRSIIRWGMMRVLVAMLVVSLVLAVIGLVPPQSVLADDGPGERVEPDAVCYCCRSFGFCWDDSTDYLCYRGTWYECNNVKVCIDLCCTQFGYLALVGYGCTNLHTGCSPVPMTVQCLKQASNHVASRSTLRVNPLRWVAQRKKFSTVLPVRTWASWNVHIR